VVAFARYDHHDASRTTEPSPSYLAFIQRHGDADPKVVPLGRADTIDTLITEWSTEISWGVAGRRRDPAQAGVGV
jgi:hypothetical protein